MNNKIQELREKIIDLFLMSTAHGIPNILKADKFSIRFMWIVSLIVSASFCVFFITHSVLDFLSFDVITQIDVKYETFSQFPTISFCAEPDFDIETETYNTVHCYFNMDIECRDNHEKYFIKFNDSVFKQCYRFNSGSKNAILNSTQRGYEFGFRFGIKLNESKSNKHHSKKMIIFIHNHTVTPLTIYNKGFEISSGSRNFFHIERVYAERLENPYNDCLKDPNSFEHNKTIIKFIQNFTSYSQKYCFELCFDLNFIENNNCACNPRLGHVQKDCPGNCIFDFRKKFYKTNVVEFCAQYCPLECDSITYNIIPSYFEYPSIGTFYENERTEFNNKFNSYEEVKKSYFEFNVYYSELKYIYMGEVAKTQISDLVSNIGGTFGLFIGISFLSFIELVEVIFEVFLSLISRKINHS